MLRRENVMFPHKKRFQCHFMMQSIAKLFQRCIAHLARRPKSQEGKDFLRSPVMSHDCLSTRRSAAIKILVCVDKESIAKYAYEKFLRTSSSFRP